MYITTVIVGSLLALAFVGAGGSKLAGAPPMRESANHLGVPYSTFRWIGAAEIAGAIGIIIGLLHHGLAGINLGVLAAACLAIVMIGAVTSHARAGDPPAGWAPPATLAILLVAFIGLRVATL